MKRSKPKTARSRLHPQVAVTLDAGVMARLERYRDRVVPGSSIATVSRVLIILGLEQHERREAAAKDPHGGAS